MEVINHPVKYAEGAICIYTDGSCFDNPGPMGLGVVYKDLGKDTLAYRQFGEFAGEGTNNIAELAAIRRGLLEVPPNHRDRPVYLHCDSRLSLRILSGAVRATKNAELVADILTLCVQFPQLHLVWTEGHTGIPENHQCDILAKAASRKNI